MFFAFRYSEKEAYLSSDGEFNFAHLKSKGKISRASDVAVYG